jgi:hypothetical protein
MKKQKQQPKRRRKHGKPSRDERGGMQVFEHPLSRMDPEVVKAALLAVADRKIDEFPKLLDVILQLFREKYPPHILSVVASYGLRAGVSRSGVRKRLSSKIEQHHVEVLQALALILPEEEWGQSPAAPGDMQNAFDTIGELAAAFRYRRYKAMEREADEQARAVLSLQERLRLHTQGVRNWGSYSQVIRISTELYAPVDDLFRDALGFSASDLISTGRNLVGLLEERSTAWFRWLRRVFREDKILRILRAYHKNHPLVDGDPDELMKIIPPGTTREQLLSMLLSHADLLLVETMQFTATQAAQASGLPEDVVQRVLRALASSPGDLRGENPEHLFMANPIWTAPIIALEGQYFCPMPHSIFSHIHSIMHCLADKVGVLPQLEERRADYLEKRVGDLLAAALPSATVRNCVKWRVGDAGYETDHVALIDKTAVIVEDKSAALTGPGLRGAFDRVRRHVRDLIADPSEQSARLEAMIWRAKAGDVDAAQCLAPFDLDFGVAERVVRVSVTLDDFSILSSAEPDLKKAGWIPPELALAPTLNLADFESVIEILEKPSFLLHYFSERQRVQKDSHIFANEMDFLGCYFDTGLNLGDLDEQKLALALTGMSKPIDHYYDSNDAGIVVSKPKPKLASYMRSLVSAIEAKAFPGWTTITSDLLRCGTYDEQRRLEKLMAELKIKVERSWRDAKHQCSLVVHSHALQGTVVVFFVYPPQRAEHRKEIAEDLASQIFDSRDCDRCVVICRNTCRWNEPYASVLIFSRAKVRSGFGGIA